MRPTTARSIPAAIRGGRTINFAAAERRVLAEKAETWREASSSLRDWRASMAAYVLPQLGSMHVGVVATVDIKRVPRPRWRWRTSMPRRA